jgi:hypothetical protein
MQSKEKILALHRIHLQRVKSKAIAFLGYGRLTLAIFYVIVILLNLSLRSKIPTYAGFYAPHDDTLGVKLAANILDGNWLGPWDNLTFAKPPGYSIYLSFASFFPIQLVTFNQLLFCLIALLFSRLLHSVFLTKVKHSEIISYFSFVFLIFNPYLFSIEMSRAYRTSTHAIFVFAYLTIALSAIYCINRFEVGILTAAQFRRKIYLQVSGLALIYSFLILLRPESYWILVGSVPLFILFYWMTYFRIRKERTRASQFRKLSFSLIIVSIITYLVPISLVGQLNNTKYGSSLFENYFAGNFAKAMKDWQRVEEGKDSRPYVVVSNQQRQVVYRISRNAELLKPYLDLKPGEGWLAQSCNSPTQLCDNSGPWFPWLLRDSVITGGLVQNEREFQEFFRQISRDIVYACETGKLECGQLGLGVGVKSIGEIPWRQVFEFSRANVGDALKLTLTSNGNLALADQYGASKEVLDMYHKVINYPVRPLNSEENPSYSRNLESLQKVYVWINIVSYLFALFGYLIAWRNPQRKLVFSALSIGLFSFILCVVGVGIAQVSFGWRAEGPYLNPLQPIIQFLTFLGIMVMVSKNKNITSRTGYVKSN